MYDSVGGRFLGRDPIGYFDSNNVYSYVGGNPARWRDPLGLAKVYDVTGSPNCRNGQAAGPGEPSFDPDGNLEDSEDVEEILGGYYWGIMVELETYEKNHIKGQDGGFIVFTVQDSGTTSKCDGSDSASWNDKYWYATAIIIDANGEVKMHHTNDSGLDLQYLQVANHAWHGEKCGHKGKRKFKVDVEVLTASQAANSLHLDRFLPQNGYTGTHPIGEVEDEVGRRSDKRPWKKGALNRSISSKTVKASFEYEECPDFTCSAKSTGTDGSRARTEDSYSPTGFPSPW